MVRATAIVPAGLWAGPAADVVRLDYDHRTRRRMALTCASGLEFLLDLAKPPALRAGDGLRLEDGRIVAVEAAPERLLEITCPDARTLARIAWHLGNRHLPVQVLCHTRRPNALTMRNALGHADGCAALVCRDDKFVHHPLSPNDPHPEAGFRPVSSLENFIEIQDP